MTAIEEVLLIIGMMAVTFGVRYPLMALSDRMRLPAALENALRFVPVAVLTAICVPLVLKPEGQWWISISNEYLLAGLASIGVALLSRNLLLTIVLGMGLFLVLRFFY